MKIVQGEVLALETAQPVASLLVTVFATNEKGEPVRVGSVATDPSGRFKLEVEGSKLIWDLSLRLTATAPSQKVLYQDTKPRAHAGDIETWALRIPLQALTEAGVLTPKRSAATDLPALGSLVTRAVADASFEAERQGVVRARLDPRRAASAQLATQLQTELMSRGRGGVPTAPTEPVAKRVVKAITVGLNQAKLRRPRRGFAVVTAPERAALQAAAGPGGEVPAAMVEPLLFGEVLDGPRTAIDLLASACRRPRTLAEACAEPSPPDVPPPPPPTVDQLAAAVWAQLRPQHAASGQRASDEDVTRRIDGLRVSTGPADAPAIHDFSALHVPIEDVWIDLVDDDVVDTCGQLVDELDRLGGRPTTTTSSLLDHVRTEAAFLIKQAPSVVRGGQTARTLYLKPVADPVGMPDPLTVEGTAWVSALLAELERRLGEPYRFTV